MSEYMSPLCAFCKHYREKEIPLRPFTCNAFPDEIPDKIFFECGDHRKPFDGDHGIRFEQRANMDADDEDYLIRLLVILDGAD